MTGLDASTFLELIDLTVGDSADRFVGPPAPERGGMTYGGQFLAQSIAAAYGTVDDDRFVHSLHSLFLRPGDVDERTDWTVDRVRDGRSFAVRSVTGHQQGKEVFRVLLSLHVPEQGLEHRPTPEISLSELPRPEDVAVSYVDFCLAHPDVGLADWSGQDRPMDIRYIDAPDPAAGPPTDAPQRTWTRLTETLPDDPRVHHAGLAYMADATLIDHVLLPHGYRWHDARLTGVSLDHAMWFYDSPWFHDSPRSDDGQPGSASTSARLRADEWLLYEQRVEVTGGARGLATGRFYTGDGVLVSSCSQEGLMRWSETAS